MSSQIFNCSYQVTKKILPFVIHTINETNILHHPHFALIINGFSTSIEMVNLRYWSSKTNFITTCTYFQLLCFLGFTIFVAKINNKTICQHCSIEVCIYAHRQMLWPLHAFFFVMKYGSLTFTTSIMFEKRSHLMQQCCQKTSF